MNLALFNTVALQGSIFSKRTGSPTGFDDIASESELRRHIKAPPGAEERRGA